MAVMAAPDISDPRFKANPHPFYARLRAESPVFRTRLPDGESAWLVARYDDVAALLKDPRLLKDRQVAMPPEQRGRAPWVPGFAKPLGRNMLDVDGLDHGRLRTLVQKAFTPQVVERLRARVQALCDQLLDAVPARRAFDLVGAYAQPLPVTVIAEMLGVPADDRGKFCAWSNQIFAVTSATDRLLVIPTLWLFVRYLRRLIDARRAVRRDDLISGLIDAGNEEDRLSGDELLSMVFMLLVAGFETTVNLIGSGTLALLQHPDQLQRLRNDPSLMGSAVEELLRFVSPIDVATERYAREDLVIAGQPIRRGEQVLGLLGSANHDDRVFNEPDVLDITRQPNRHLAFGQGPHYCLGAPLARLEGSIALITLLRRLPELRLAGPAESLQWRKGMFLRGLKELPVAH